MYAQLCKRLSDEASNFLIDQDPNTFRELLLKRCKVEFDNRSKATAEFDNDNGTTLSPEDEERRQVAKRKMLGNIRFIGELGKLEIVAEQILHLCIQQLFPRKSNVKDAAEDLECLCQIMKTCGRILDTEKAKPLMNQYFDRIAQYAENPELPLRIKFMLLDTMQLRKDNWVPRKATTTEGPMLMDQVTDIVSGETNGQNQRNNQMQNVNQSKEMFRRSLKIRDDMISSTPVLPFNSTMPDKFNSINGFTNSGNFYNVNGRKNQGLLNLNSSSNIYYSPARVNYTINTQQNINTNSNMNNNNMKDLGPNIKKLLRAQQGTKPEDMSLRPPANSMLCKPIQIKPPPISMTNIGQSNHIKSDVQQIQIKPNSHEKHKHFKKDKGVSKEEAIKKGLDVLDKLGTDPSMDAVKAAKSFVEIKVPDKFLADVMYVLLFDRLRKRVDLDEELLLRFIQETKKQNIVSEAIAIDCLKHFVLKGPEYESDDDKTLYKRFSKYAGEICQNVTSITEIAKVSENGKRYPAFLMVLQELNEVIGKNKLTAVFKESKVNILNTLPESLRTKEQLADILQERNLTFLFPLLCIQSDLWKQITSDSSPTQFYKWIKENLDPAHYTDPGFITALTTVMAKFITQETNSTELNAPKSDLEKEKSLLEKFKPIMRTFFDNRIDLQMNSIYALQMYFYSLDFPKGLLLRWFNLMYELEIIEEEAFFKWREDVTDEYPGKGKALFQVNTWLTWLAEAESEDEEDDDD
ncbi:Hypothetical protein CINCED_3A005143 [Cinara cedri]|nr:Hypothetical protein CINCED_3A005143 [Cinara cedri]